MELNEHYMGESGRNVSFADPSTTGTVLSAAPTSTGGPASDFVRVTIEHAVPYRVISLAPTASERLESREIEQLSAPALAFWNNPADDAWDDDL